MKGLISLIIFIIIMMSLFLTPLQFLQCYWRNTQKNGGHRPPIHVTGDLCQSVAPSSSARALPISASFCKR